MSEHKHTYVTGVRWEPVGAPAGGNLITPYSYGRMVAHLVCTDCGQEAAAAGTDARWWK